MKHTQLMNILVVPEELRNWIATNGYDSVSAWTCCERADWMFYLARLLHFGFSHLFIVAGERCAKLANSYARSEVAPALQVAEKLRVGCLTIETIKNTYDNYELSEAWMFDEEGYQVWFTEYGAKENWRQQPTTWQARVLSLSAGRRAGASLAAALYNWERHREAENTASYLHEPNQSASVYDDARAAEAAAPVFSSLTVDCLCRAADAVAEGAAYAAAAQFAASGNLSGEALIEKFDKAQADTDRECAAVVRQTFDKYVRHL